MKMINYLEICNQFKKYIINILLFLIITNNLYGTGYVKISQGVNISPSSVTFYQNFSVTFTLTEIQGGSITFDTIAVAILKPDGSHLFDCKKFSSVSFTSNSNWTPDPITGQIYDNGITGNYTVVIRGKVSGGQWFDFTTTGSGVNSVTFNVNQAPQYGSVKVTISPDEAVSEGAQWQLDETGNWYNSDYTLYNVSTGNHTVNFKTIGGWNSPGSQLINITANNPYPVTGTYVQIPSSQYGFVNVSISPIDAINAGAKWQLDETGSWYSSGYTLSNVSTGNHYINFNSISGWTSPNIINIIVSANQTIDKNGTYIQIPVQKDINLNVPFIPQCPPGIWAKTDNCGQTSVLQVAKFYKNESPIEQDIKDIDDWLFNNLALPINNYNGSPTDVDILKKLAEQYFLLKDVKIHTNWTCDSIINELKHGFPVIVAVRIGMSSDVKSIGHFMVCRGVTFDSNYFYFNDPGRSIKSKMGQNIKYSKLEFNNSWGTQNYSCITIHDIRNGSASNPLNLVADLELESNTISICWDSPVLNSLKCFNIYRNDILIDSTDNQTTIYNDSTSLPGINYCYKVVPMIGISEISNSDSICYSIDNYMTYGRNCYGFTKSGTFFIAKQMIDEVQGKAVRVGYNNYSNHTDNSWVYESENMPLQGDFYIFDSKDVYNFDRIYCFHVFISASDTIWLPEKLIYKINKQDTVSNNKGSFNFHTYPVDTVPAHSCSFGCSPETEYNITDTVVFSHNEIYTLPDGRKVNVEGTYTSNLLTCNGCDSIVVTTLIINPTIVIDGDFDKRVNTFPIPVTNLLNIESSFEIESLQLTDVTGNLIYRKENIRMDKDVINMFGHKAGYYTLVINIKGSMAPIMRKIIKQ